MDTGIVQDSTQFNKVIAFIQTIIEADIMAYNQHFPYRLMVETFGHRVPEIADWCRENCSDIYLFMPTSYPLNGRVHLEYVWFTSLRDATAFKLRWL